jgi:hypothetical protein
MSFNEFFFTVPVSGRLTFYHFLHAHAHCLSGGGGGGDFFVYQNVYSINQVQVSINSVG